MPGPSATTRSWISFFGLSGWLGGEGRARRLAAAALHAGVERQQLVPAEVARRLAAELGRVERQRPQRGLARPAGETGGARMEGEVERAGEGVAHGADAHACEQLPAAPGADHQQHEAADLLPLDRAPEARLRRAREGEEERKGEERVGQALEGAARKPGRRGFPAPQCHHEGAHRHDGAGAQQQAGQPLAFEAEDMDEQDEQHGGDEAARRQHVHLGRIAVARDDVMDVDQVAPRQPEGTQPVQRRGAAGEPTARAPERADREQREAHQHEPAGGGDADHAGIETTDGRG